MIFQFLQIAFLLTRGDFSTGLLEEIKNEIGFKRLKGAMKHQIVMCLDQALGVSIREDVKAHEARDLAEFFTRPKGYETGYHWDRAIEMVIFGYVFGLEVFLRVLSAFNKNLYFFFNQCELKKIFFKNSLKSKNNKKFY